MFLSLFGLSVFIIQYSVFITQYPNFVDPTASCFVWMSFQSLFSWLRACLDEESFEWYHLVFCFHYPNCVGPTAQHLFGLVLNHGFHHSWLNKMDDEWPKLKTGFTCFQNSKTEFRWQVDKLDEVVGPFASALSHPEQACAYYH